MQAALDWAPNYNVPIPENELERLKKLYEYEPLDKDPIREKVFERLAQLAAEICEVPISFINLTAEDKEYKKAAFGYDGQTVPREITFCQFTIMSDEIYEVNDASTHPMFKTNPHVITDFNLQFYAGMPLTTPEGYNVGSLCVIDHHPKSLSKSQKIALHTLAQEVVSQFELNLSRRELEKLLKEKDEMLKLVSHDMRNPLMGIIGASDLLQAEIEDQDLSEIISIVNDSGKNLLGIVNTLLNSNYIKQHGFSVNRKMTNVSSISEDVILMHKASALVKNIEMVTYFETDELHFKVDVEKWKQILGNLVSNAIKFTPEAGRVKIELKQGTLNQNLILVVSDSGIGIPEEIKMDLFSGKLSIRRKGTAGEDTSGIGLPMVKRYVDLHRGSITCGSTEEFGTIFKVILPK